MHTIDMTPERLALAKTRLKKNLGLKSAHLSEALAKSLGARSHASLRSALQSGPVPTARPLEIPAFLERLCELGHEPNAVHAEMAIVHALGPHRGVFPHNTPAQTSHALTEHVNLARKALARSRSWTRPMLEYEGVPDPTVQTIRVDRDVWRWNPTFLKELRREELTFLVLATALHRYLGHPARRSVRDPRIWAMACELVVNDAVINAGVGDFLGVHWNPTFNRRRSAEEVYDDLVGGADQVRVKLQPRVGLGDWRIADKNWPKTADNVIPEAEADMAFYDQVTASYPWRSVDVSLHDEEIISDVPPFAFLEEPVRVSPEDADGFDACRTLAGKLRNISDDSERCTGLDSLLDFALTNLGASVAKAVARHCVFELGIDPDCRKPGWIGLLEAV